MSNKMKNNNKVIYPLSDDDLADLSRRSHACELEELHRRHSARGTSIKMTDGDWTYVVVEDHMGSWTWGFKTEA